MWGPCAVRWVAEADSDAEEGVHRSFENPTVVQRICDGKPTTRWRAAFDWRRACLALGHPVDCTDRLQTTIGEFG